MLDGRWWKCSAKFLSLLVGIRPLDQVCHLCKSYVRVVFPHKITGTKELDSR